MGLEFQIDTCKKGEINFNYIELKAELERQLVQYDNLVVTEDELPKYKAIRSKLNNVIKAMNDRKIEIKNLYLEPYKEFENQVKDLMLMVDSVNGKIDAQLRDFEEQRKIKKKNEIVEEYEQLKSEIPLDKIWNEKWLNKTYLKSDIFNDIQKLLSEIDECVKVIETISNGSDEDFANLKSKYLATLDIKGTIEAFNNEKRIREQISSVKPEINESKETFKLSFEVEGTKEQIKELSNFLKSNKYQYRRLS